MSCDEQVNYLGKNLMLAKCEGRRRGRERQKWLDGSDELIAGRARKRCEKLPSVETVYIIRYQHEWTPS